ncbi:MAG: fructosamine kinase family protein [Bacteroidota bacterium]
MDHQKILSTKLKEKIRNISPLSGGDINDVYKIETDKNNYVLKLNQENSFPDMFKKEKNGLISIAQTGAKTPKVIHCFTDSGIQFLILDFIKEESISNIFWKYFAEDLVKLHKKQSNFFGLEYDNYIGSLNQINTIKKTWNTFFVEDRLDPLVKKAFDLNRLQRYHLKSFKNLYLKLNEILPIEKPSLIHGDLWSGNLMCGKGQTPFFIDPAIYFGNREIDIAMTQLFGGFDHSYLTFYNEIYPLEKGWEERINIHNLYPRLVHLILFGKSYLNGIESVLKKF